MATSDNTEHNRLETLRVRRVNYATLDIECSRSVAAELREHFSFFVPGYKFMPAFRNRVWDGKIRLFNSQTNELPNGLYSHLLEFTDRNKYVVESYDDVKYGNPATKEPIDPKNLLKFVESLNLPFTIRDYQFAACAMALERTNAILLSPTGSGKSLIIYVIVKYFLLMLTNGVKYPKGGRVLVIVPTTSLVEQMHNDFISYGQEERGMHKIYSGKDKNFDKAICISTWQSIYKLPKTWYDQFGMVIGDECHGFKSKSLMSIMNKAAEAKYRFGTTGTLDGTQTHELVLQGLFGKTIKVTTTKSLQDNDTLAPLEITRLVLEHDEQNKKDMVGKTYQDEIDYIVTNEKRNKFITNLVNGLEGNSLVLFQYVDKHGKPLFDLISNKVEENRKVFFVSGQTDTADREAIRGITEKQKNGIIVASLGTFSTGINIRNLHNIIFASPSKSQIRVLQSIGRGLRKSDDGSVTKLYDLIDDISWKSNKNFALLHGFERAKIYNNEKFNYKSYKVKI